MKLRRALAIIAAIGAGSAVWAAEFAPPLHVSAGEIAKMVEKPVNGTAGGRVPLGDRDPQVVVARRMKPGDIEVHEGFGDLVMVRAGRATVMVGGTVTGNRQTGPGEWRGGTVTGAKAYQLATGDVLWIPPGASHQVTMPDGGDYTYMVVKSPKAAEVSPPVQMSAGEIVKSVEKPANGLAVSRVALGDRDPQVVVARRTQSGEVEVHDALSDLLVGRVGTATLLVGGKVAGNRQTGPGEWRGGTISGGTSYKIGPGDVLWIPAGVPHLVQLPAKGDFTYLVVKTPKP